MVMDVNLICCGDNFTMYTNSESLYCVPETDIMLYVSYISIFKYYVVRLVLFKSSVEFFVYFSRQLTWLTKSPDYRSGDSSVNSAFKTFGIVCWGWKESSALAWDSQGRRVVVCTVVKFPRLCFEFLILFQTCPARGWAWGSHWFISELDSLLHHSGIFSQGLLFIFPLVRKMDYCKVLAYMVFGSSTWGEVTGERREKKNKKAFFSPELCTAGTLVPVPLSRETGFLVGCQVLASLWCHQCSCTTSTGLGAGLEGKRRKKEKHLVSPSPLSS